MRERRRRERERKSEREREKERERERERERETKTGLTAHSLLNHANQNTQMIMAEYIASFNIMTGR